MKKTLLIAMSATSFLGFSQKQISVTKLSDTITSITQQTFSVEIPQTKLKDVENDWIKYTGNGSKGKATLVNGEYLQTDVENKNISAYPFNVQSRLVETVDGVKLSASINQNNNAFVSKELNSGVDQAIQKYLRDFAIQEYQQAVKEELKEEERKLDALEKAYAASINTEEKSGKKINDDYRSNDRANDAITTTESDIRKSSDKIENQKDRVELNAADKNAAKGAKKTLRALEKDKKKMQNQNENKEKKMENRDAENRELERDIITAQQNQSRATEAIEKQKQVVAAVRIKLDNIR